MDLDHEPHRLCHASTVHRDGARRRRRAGERPGHLADADRHFPQSEPAGRSTSASPMAAWTRRRWKGCSPTTTSTTSSTSAASTTSRARNVQGMALMKLFFHPGTNMAQAMAETINYVNRSRAFMPPGTVSPFVMRFDTGSVPVGYLVLSSETQSIGEIQDLALVQGAADVREPAGRVGAAAVWRQSAHGRRACRSGATAVLLDVAGRGDHGADDGQHDQPVGQCADRRRRCRSCRSTRWFATCRTWGRFRSVRANPPVYLRDVGDGRTMRATSLTGYALVNGRRAVYILVTKRADASTLSVVNNVKDALPKMQAVLPDDIKVSFEFDQSPYVTRRGQEPGRRGSAGRDSHRADGPGLSARLAQRDRRGPQYSVGDLRRVRGAVAHGSDDQPDDAGRPGAGGRHSGRRSDGRDREHPRASWTGRDRSPRPCARATWTRPCRDCWRCCASWRCSSRRSSCRGRPRRCSCRCRWRSAFAMVASYLLSSTFVPVLSTWMLADDHGTRRGGQAVVFRSIARRLRPDAFGRRSACAGRSHRRIWR